MSKMVRILSVLLILGISLSMSLTPSTSSASIVDGLVAYYPFNGNVLDYGSNGNNGTVFGAIPSGDRFNNSDGAYCFDGTDDHITVSNPINIPTGNDCYTIQAWIKPNTMGARTIVSWGSAAGNQMNAVRLSDNGIYNYWFDNDLHVVTGNLVDGLWHYVVATFDGTTRKIFLDGKCKGSDSPIANHLVTSINFKIGGTYFGEYFNGSIDDLRIYNRALTQAEIDTLFTQGPTNWPMFQYDAQHMGKSPFTGPQTNTVRWTYYIGENSQSSPAIGKDGTIYAGSADWKLYAVNPDGTLQWTFPTGGAILSSPAIGEDGTIYVGSMDYKIYAIKPNGILKWAYETLGGGNASPVIGDGGVIYVCSYDRNIYALNIDGTLKWKYYAGLPLHSTPAIGPDGVIYFGIPNGKMVALNPDGTEKWISIRHSTNGFWATPTVSTDGTVVYCGADDGAFYALNTGDGSLKWKSPFTYGGVQSSAAIGKDGTVYVGTQYGYLWALNPEDGSKKWELYPTLSAWSSPAIGGDDTIYFATDYGHIYAVNPDKSIKWVYQGNYSNDGHFHSSPAIGDNGTLYIVSTNGKLYAFNKPGCKGDFDKDGDVDVFDLGTFASEFGRTDCKCDAP